MTDIDVQYYAQWDDAGDPDVEPLTGDNLEMAQRASRLADLREERAEAERRAELEDRAEQLMRTAPTMAEVLARVERQTRAEDFSNDRREAAERAAILAGGGVERAASDLSDLRARKYHLAAEFERQDAEAAEARAAAPKRRLSISRHVLPERPAAARTQPLVDAWRALRQGGVA